ERGGKGPRLAGRPELVFGGRADVRFSIDAAGELYLYSKGDGVIRKVVGAGGFDASPSEEQPFDSSLTLSSSKGELLAQDRHDQHGAMPPDAIGSASVKFETSCAAAVKDDFNKAVALLHSFWFPEAIKSFDSILARDPN